MPTISDIPSWRKWSIERKKPPSEPLAETEEESTPTNEPQSTPTEEIVEPKEEETEEPGRDAEADSQNAGGHAPLQEDASRSGVEDNVRQQKAEDVSPLTAEEAVLRDTLADLMWENGMEVITDKAEGQRVLDEANGNVQLQAKNGSSDISSDATIMQRI